MYLLHLSLQLETFTLFTKIIDKRDLGASNLQGKWGKLVPQQHSSIAISY